MMSVADRKKGPHLIWGSRTAFKADALPIRATSIFLGFSFRVSYKRNRFDIHMPECCDVYSKVSMLGMGLSVLKGVAERLVPPSETELHPSKPSVMEALE